MRAPVVLLPAGAVLLGATLAATWVPAEGTFGSLDRARTVAYLVCMGLSGVACLVAVAFARRGAAPGWAVWFVLGVGVVARTVVLIAPPIHSTDLYRYVWDGRVQAAGINPYRYVPADPVLADLRDSGSGATAIYPNINRADTAPTIYPPAAQALFALVGLVHPGVWAVKTVMLGFDLVVTGIGLLLLRSAALPALQIAAWAWNPLVIWEFANGGHIDAAALAFSALALLAAIRLRPALAGLALGVAVLMKLLPAALFPAIWRRWNLVTPGAAALVILGLYAAYASAGLRVFGYLPGYAQEEGLDGGNGFLALRLLRLTGPLPAWSGTAYLVVALALLALLSLWIVRAPLPSAPGARAWIIGRDALVLSGALLAVLSPHYPWYMTMLVLPAIMVPAWSALWVSIAAPLLYLDFGLSQVVWPALVFLPAIPLLLLDFATGRRATLPALLVERGS